MKKWILAILLIASPLYAANIYVDGTLSSDCPSGNYSTSARNCTGSAGNAYNTVQEAFTAMSGGDDIYIRGGTYQEGHINILPAKNGTSSKWSTMQSYPSEWAILDGQRNCSKDSPSYGSVLGFAVFGYEDIYQLKYWRFERLEITGGGSSDGTWAAGFFANGGPFHFKYCYIHDNLASVMNNNPGGLVGHAWHDSIVEYSYFNNNGSDGTQSMNCGNIVIYGDYQPNWIAVNGFPSATPISNARNEYRYNYIVGSQVGIRYKDDQFFTGRNAAGGHPLSDTYKTYGDKVHHNIIKDAGWGGIDGRQDFIQIYNNIIDSCVGGIKIGETDTRTIYKSTIYNNTVISPTNVGISKDFNKAYGYDTEDPVIYGYEYNNIIDAGIDGWNWSDSSTLSSYYFSTTLDYSNDIRDRDYFYRPATSSDDTDGTKVVFRKPSSGNPIRYTVAEYEALYSGVNLYRNTYNAGDLLYVGTSGADKYITRGTHILEGSTVIANGGIGGAHPYLTGVTIPSYVGATNPSDNGWVATVLLLSNINYLMSGGSLGIISIGTGTPNATIGSGSGNWTFQ